MLRRRLLLSGGFDPRSLGSLVLWLDASDSSTLTFATGAKISQWADKSGNNNHFYQATGLRQPSYTATGINNKPSITFDGSLTYMTCDSSLITAKTNWTMLLAIKADSVFANTRYVFVCGDVGTGIGFSYNGNSVANPQKKEIYFAGLGFLADDSQTTNSEIWAINRNTTISSHFTNGVYQTTVDDNANPINTPINHTYIGGVGLTTNLFGGNISDVLVYNRYLSASEIFLLTTKLNNRKGVY